jgi:hypothetical protein
MANAINESLFVPCMRDLDLQEPMTERNVRIIHLSSSIQVTWCDEMVLMRTMV